ncbi:MAG: Rrf2 family transcriptional regulator [Paracoccaceae bacterium]|nr:MAG: Rrf2 family transcriptional regulator [Paracoccaceae bacterium]
MRLTIRTNLALRTLMFCAVNNDRTVRKHEVAVACRGSENHLAQVIHALAIAGFLTTVRGRAGGLRLARPATAITVGDVVRKFEGPVPFAPCMDPGDTSCPLIGCCRLTCVLAAALEAFHAALDRVTVADLVDGNAPLADILRVT